MKTLTPTMVRDAVVAEFPHLGVYDEHRDLVGTWARLSDALRVEASLTLSQREAVSLGEAVMEVQRLLGGVGHHKVIILPALLPPVPWRVRYERHVKPHLYRRAEGSGHSLAVAFSALACRLREMGGEL